MPGTSRPPKQKQPDKLPLKVAHGMSVCPGLPGCQRNPDQLSRDRGPTTRRVGPLRDTAVHSASPLTQRKAKKWAKSCQKHIKAALKSHGPRRYRRAMSKRLQCLSMGRGITSDFVLRIIQPSVCTQVFLIIKETVNKLFLKSKILFFTKYLFY